MHDNHKTVHIVDDDVSIRKALARLLRSQGYMVEAFASAEEFLESGVAAQTNCLILDMRMTGMSGLELQEKLLARGLKVHIIFITAHDDPQSYEQAVKNGAMDFLRKPFDQSSLLHAVKSVFRGERPEL